MQTGKRKLQVGLQQWMQALPFLLAGFVLMALFVLYPLVRNIWISCTDFNVIQNRPNAWVGLRNYLSLLSDQIFLHASHWNTKCRSCHKFLLLLRSKINSVLLTHFLQYGLHVGLFVEAHKYFPLRVHQNLKDIRFRNLDFRNGGWSKHLYRLLLYEC